MPHDSSLKDKLCAKENALAHHLSDLSFYKDNYFPIKNQLILQVFYLKNKKNAFHTTKSPVRIHYMRTGLLNVFIKYYTCSAVTILLKSSSEISLWFSFTTGLSAATSFSSTARSANWFTVSRCLSNSSA